MKKINCVEDLPDWFDLEKYKKAESFSAADWYSQLRYRKNLLTSNPKFPSEWEDDDSGEIDTNMERWRELMKEVAPKLRDDPISHEKNEPYLTKTSLKPVEPMTVGELQHIVHLETFSSRRRGELGLADYITAPINTKPPEEIKNQLIEQRPIAPEFVTRAALLVNLAASDSMLIEMFKSWLKTARTRHPYYANRRRSAYDRWARYGILPYIDLKMWEIETDSNIPDRVMSAAISKYDVGEANLRITIAPLAVKLLRDLSELQASAAAESITQASDERKTFEG